MVFPGPLASNLVKSSLTFYHQRCPPIEPHKNFSTRPEKTHYEELGVSENATAKEIKNAFIIKSKKLHPDINPNKPELHDAFVKISAAYNVIGSPESRKSYDLRLSSHHSSNNCSYSSSNPFGSGYRDNAYSHYTDQKSWSENYKYPPVQRVLKKNPYHKYVVLGALLFMFCGATAHYFIINYSYKRRKAYFDEISRKADLAFAESKKRARSNGSQPRHEFLRTYYSQQGGNYITKYNIDDSDNSLE